MLFIIKDARSNVIGKRRIYTIRGLKKLSYEHRGFHRDIDHSDLIVDFGKSNNNEEPTIYIYNDYVE